MRKVFALLLSLALIMVLGAGSALAVPADGNHNKFVVEVHEGPFPVPCNGGSIDFNIDGWLQGRQFGPENNRNIALTVFHFVLAYTNGDGETWTYNDVGPDRVYLVGDEVHLALTGRPGGIPHLGGSALFGHIVINLVTDEVVLVAGNEFGVLDEAACDALS